MAIDVRELSTPFSTRSSRKSSTSTRRPSVNTSTAGSTKTPSTSSAVNHGVYGQRQAGATRWFGRQGALRVGHGPSSSRRAPTSPRPTPRLGSPHHPPERPVPLRRARAGRPRSCADWRRSGSRRVRPAATPSATSWAAISPARARIEKLDISALGRGNRPLACCATPTRSACPASSRSTSRAARPTAAKPCSTTSASSPRTRTLADGRRSRLPGVRRRRSRRQPAPGAGARGVHRLAKTCCPPSRRASARSTTTATATTRSEPA